MKIKIIATVFVVFITVIVRANADDELKAEGGLLLKPYTGKYVVIVNDQNRIPTNRLFAADGGISGLFNYPVMVVDKNTKLAKAGLVVTVSDNLTAPSLLVAPEVPWAGVNVAALAIDNPKPEILTIRLQKEIFRAFLYACGVANSEVQPCLMRPIYNVKDLDKANVLQPGPSAVGPVMATAGRLGIFEQMPITYREACQQGWAPAPTNEIQKAIWDKVRATPKNPMKIEFDPKKGR